MHKGTYGELIGLKGLNVIFILCADTAPVQRGHCEIHQNFTGSTVHSERLINKVWFWDNGGMG